MVQTRSQNKQKTTEEEKMLQAAVRDFAERELKPRAREMDEKEEFSYTISILIFMLLLLLLLLL